MPKKSYNFIYIINEENLRTCIQLVYDIDDRQIIAAYFTYYCVFFFNRKSMQLLTVKFAV